MNKTTIASVIISGALIVGAVIMVGGSEKNNIPNPSTKTNVDVNAKKDTNSTSQKTTITSNVTIVNGKQIIEINAKGGYYPQRSIAKAGIPTIIRFNTNGTFDCSSSIRIPSINVFKNLSLSGSTDIDVGSNSVGVLQGSCGMGMYPFAVDFQN